MKEEVKGVASGVTRARWAHLPQQMVLHRASCNAHGHHFGLFHALNKYDMLACVLRVFFGGHEGGHLNGLLSTLQRGATHLRIACNGDASCGQGDEGREGCALPDQQNQKQ